MATQDTEPGPFDRFERTVGAYDVGVRRVQPSAVRETIADLLSGPAV